MNQFDVTVLKDAEEALNQLGRTVDEKTFEEDCTPLINAIKNIRLALTICFDERYMRIMLLTRTITVPIFGSNKADKQSCSIVDYAATYLANGQFEQSRLAQDFALLLDENNGWLATVIKMSEIINIERPPKFANYIATSNSRVAEVIRKVGRLCRNKNSQQQLAIFRSELTTQFDFATLRIQVQSELPQLAAKYQTMSNTQDVHRVATPILKNGDTQSQFRDLLSTV